MSKRRGTPTKYGRRYAFSARGPLADWLEERATENDRGVAAEVLCILEHRFNADRERARRDAKAAVRSAPLPFRPKPKLKIAGIDEVQDQ